MKTSQRDDEGGSNMTRIQKRLLVLALFSALFIILSGCSGGGGGKPVDHTETKEAVQKAALAFRDAVEDYDVEGMLHFLDRGGFTLVIKEVGQSLQGSKDYATLEAELRDDEEKQLRWRQEPPEGYGYVLTMELGEIVFSNLSSTGAIATTTFKVFEKAQRIENTVTDTGQIVLEMVKLEGKWLCRKMSTNFEKTGSKILGQWNSHGHLRGFGFGSINVR